MTDHKTNPFNIFLLVTFLLLTTVSVAYCYQTLLVNREYSIFFSEDEVAAAPTGLFDGLIGKFYGSAY